MKKSDFKIGSTGFALGPILFITILAVPIYDLTPEAKVVLGLSLWMGVWWVSEADPSQNALRVALDIAKTNDATVHLLYVIHEVILPNYFGREQLKKTMKEYEKEIYADLKKNALNLLQAQKQKTRHQAFQPR